MNWCMNPLELVWQSLTCILAQAFAAASFHHLNIDDLANPKGVSAMGLVWPWLWNSSQRMDSIDEQAIAPIGILVLNSWLYSIHALFISLPTIKDLFHRTNAIGYFASREQWLHLITPYMLDALDTIFWFLVGRKIQPNKIAFPTGSWPKI